MSWKVQLVSVFLLTSIHASSCQANLHLRYNENRTAVFLLELWHTNQFCNWLCVLLSFCSSEWRKRIQWIWRSLEQMLWHVLAGSLLVLLIETECVFLFCFCCHQENIALAHLPRVILFWFMLFRLKSGSFFFLLQRPVFLI